MYSTFELLELLTQRNGGKIIGASLDNDVRSRLGKKMSYLKSKQFIKKSDGIWEITPQGKKYFSKKNNLKKFSSPFTRNQKKEYLVMFDIPETERLKRNYIRNQLKAFDYTLIQKSVWYGPGPLPEEFIHYLKKINIRDNIMIFKTNQKII